MSTASVVITSEPPGEMLSVAGGRNESIQIVRGFVECQGAVPKEQTFIVASGISLSAEKYQGVLGSLASENPDLIIGLIVSESSGSVSVLSLRQDHNAFPIAAAVVAFKASWGWDESQPIVVRVDDDEFELYATFEGSEALGADSP